MTVTMEQFHQCSVDVHVIHEQFQDPLYTREIVRHHKRKQDAQHAESLDLLEAAVAPGVVSRKNTACGLPTLTIKPFGSC